jgi:hypothetical protein
MTKLLAVRYPSSVDRVRSGLNHLNKVIEVEDANTIKNLIGELLFNINTLFRYNYCLIKHNNKLYVIEATDYDKNLYSRKSVDYHPLSHLI